MMPRRACNPFRASFSALQGPSRISMGPDSASQRLLRKMHFHLQKKSKLEMKQEILLTHYKRPREIQYISCSRSAYKGTGLLRRSLRPLKNFRLKRGLMKCHLRFHRPQPEAQLFPKTLPEVGMIHKSRALFPPRPIRVSGISILQE